MPSQARRKFDENASDVANLILVYEAMELLWKDEPEEFPEGAEVLFRSAAVLLVSHWEAYIEDICGEALEHLVKNAKDSSRLPKAIKQQVAAEVNGAKDTLEMWKLADEGWRNYLRCRLTAMKEGRDRGFNTPKAEPTKTFIKNTVGIEDITKKWDFDGMDSSLSARKLDALISLRGEIAHRGRIKERLNKDYIADHLEFLKRLVARTGGEINAHLRKHTGKSLWKSAKSRKAQA